MPGMRGDWHVPFVRTVNFEMIGTAGAMRVIKKRKRL